MNEQKVLTENNLQSKKELIYEDIDEQNKEFQDELFRSPMLYRLNYEGRREEVVGNLPFKSSLPRITDRL